MRVKRGVVSRRKHKKLLGFAKGYRMTKHRLIKVAKEAVLHAGSYAYAGRRKKKSDMRRLWITRISHFVRNYGLSYNNFVYRLKKQNIILDRKMLSQLLLKDENALKSIIDKVKSI